DLAKVLDRMVQKRVQDRYASAAASLKDLTAAAAVAPKTIKKMATPSDETLQARSSWQAPPEPAPTRGGAKSPVLPILAGLLAAFLLGIGVYIFWPFKSDKIAVTIASLPPHAKVYLDGAAMQKGTDAVYDLAPGEYKLRLELDEYEPFEAKIGVAENRRVHKVTLAKATASVTPKIVEPKIDANKEPKRITPKTVAVDISSEPPGASVSINGERQAGKTNGKFVVPEGPFALKIEMPGYKPVEKRIASPDELKTAFA